MRRDNKKAKNALQVTPPERGRYPDRSAPSMHPWDLNEGLRFEQTGALLRWGTPFETLRASSTVTVLQHETSIHLSWPADQFLGGIAAIASACQIFETPNPRAYHIYLPTLHYVGLDILETHSEPREAHRQLRRLHDHLVAGLGPATFSYPDYSQKLPAIFWKRGALVISIGPNFGRAHLQLTIMREPDGYEELKREAAAIRAREGEGARVDYVAWYAPFDD